MLRSLTCLTFLFSTSLPILAAEPAPPLSASANGQVAIPLAGLGHPYLMSMSIIPQQQAATSTGLASRVVHFELFGDEVDLYESTDGLVVTDDLPARQLLATFPITQREQDRVTIDFNQGMRRVFTTIWYGGDRFNGSGRATVMEVPQSRVFEIADKGGRLAIRQAVQARSRQRSQDVEQRLEVRYFLSPYQPGDFEKKENGRQDQRYVRFFETPATLELNSGRAVAHIARFDLDKPLTFYYSANTPDEYVDAIRGGVLYWNRAFDREFIRCERAPDGVTAPSADHNIVQWVPWDSAGFAYADVLIDPLTGQSMHGQAYMTSVFAISGVQRARILWRRMESMRKDAEEKDDSEEEQATISSKLLGLPLFRSTVNCQCDPSEFAGQLADGLTALLDKGDVTDEQILQASKDYVRHVTAHEVGHVLGLRHNFAGSLAGTLSPKDLDTWFDDYLREEETPSTEAVTTNSTMEYSAFQSAVYCGCRIRTSDAMLPHDRAAIRWGYFGEETAREEKLLFATDGDVGTWADVIRFDYGAEPVVAAMHDMGKAINGLPGQLIETFIAAKAPRDRRDVRPLDQVNLSASTYASRFIGAYRSAFRWFNASNRSLRIERDFSYVGPLNEEQRQAAHWKSLQSQVGKVGGIERLGFGFLPLKLSLDLKPKVVDADPPEKFSAAGLSKTLGELLESDAYHTFIGADGEEHSFTEEEQELIKERTTQLFKELEHELLTRFFQAWSALPRNLGRKVSGYVADDDMTAKLERQLIAAAKRVILARDNDDGERIRGKVYDSFVEVVDFQYKMETRKAAAQALADKMGSYPAWSKEARAAIAKDLKTAVDSSLNIQNFKEFKDEKLSRPVRDWYLEQQTLLRALPK